MAEDTFIIRIWCEHSEHTNVNPQFRGVIEHAISGRRQYLNSTDGINHFIQSHLPDKIENKDNHPTSITQWFKRQK